MIPYIHDIIHFTWQILSTSSSITKTDLSTTKQLIKCLKVFLYPTPSPFLFLRPQVVLLIMISSPERVITSHGWPNYFATGKLVAIDQRRIILGVTCSANIFAVYQVLKQVWCISICINLCHLLSFAKVSFNLHTTSYLCYLWYLISNIRIKVTRVICHLSHI